MFKPLPLVAALLVLTVPLAHAAWPVWQADVYYAAGSIVSYNGHDYQALVSQTDYAATGWNPNSASLWRDLGTSSNAVTPQPTPIPTALPSPQPTAAPAGGCYAAWDSSKAYNGGAQVSYAGRNYVARWWTQGDIPASNTAEGRPWNDAGSCGTALPTATPMPTATPRPSATPAPTPIPTATPRPTVTPTPAPACASWLQSQTYAAGDVVAYQGKTYTALVPHTLAPGVDWNPGSTATLWQAGGSCKPLVQPVPKFAAPALSWQEHWFEHQQNMKLIAYNDTVALYFDDDVNRDAGKWMLPYLTKMWQYAQQTYGPATLTTDRMYSLHHEAKYYGGHPSTVYDASHDYHNVSDVGGSNWINPQYEVVTHETGHVVESIASGKHGSPAFPLWGDSKWMEFYIYDAYVALGMSAQASDVYNRWTNDSDSFPRAGTNWFRDWFYPLWRDHGHAQVMNRYFQLVGQYFPNNGRDYTRNMNWGEYIHFMSGAAGTDLKAQAATAFGWPADWETQYQQAKRDFPNIRY
ncbi:Chitodextrinase [Andreprevotia lacus DSM 23236]|jgi:chitodextrinase|uniref:Chitodextrinase n=1 Tax=Andreprevotia lacus DSM 23236 TaxID=1121001 RepID=A0A1W1X3G6_9NEIS|nr:carbohydrate-binding protein [Andreprevotia lacus]SMC18340.1 Chitodextrinase [Andreprevotia lacus DSM 23236]